MEGVAVTKSSQCVRVILGTAELKSSMMLPVITDMGLVNMGDGDNDVRWVPGCHTWSPACHCHGDITITGLTTLTVELQWTGPDIAEGELEDLDIDQDIVTDNNVVTYIITK